MAWCAIKEKEKRNAKKSWKGFSMEKETVKKSERLFKNEEIMGYVRVLWVRAESSLMSAFIEGTFTFYTNFLIIEKSGDFIPLFNPHPL